MDMKTISETIPATWRSLRPDSKAMEYCQSLSRAENEKYSRALAAALEGCLASGRRLPGAGGNYVRAAAAGMLGGEGGRGAPPRDVNCREGWTSSVRRLRRARSGAGARATGAP